MEVNIGGWGTKLGEKVADEELENGRDGIEVGDIQGDAKIFEKHLFKFSLIFKTIIEICKHYHFIVETLPGEPENGVNDVEGDSGPP